MGWLGLLLAVLKLVNIGTEYLARRQLLEAGQALAIMEGTDATLAAVADAKRIDQGLADPGNGAADRLRERLRERSKARNP